MLTTFPVMVQMAVVAEPKMTGLPDAPPVALSTKVPPATKVIGVAGVNAVITCDVKAVVMLFDAADCALVPTVLVADTVNV